MPTYEYQCTACGQHIEIFQRISEDPLTTCGVCGGTLRKVFHPAGIVFKGSGFYATDSRSKATAGAGSKKSSDGDSSAGAETSSSGSSSSSSEGSSSSSGATKGSGSKTSTAKEASSS